MALEIFRLVGSVFVDTDKADKSLKKTDKSTEGVGTRLLSVVKTAGKFAGAMVAAAGAAGTAMIALAENTREYRTEQGKLETAFETSGFAASEARSTYEALNGVLGDSGQAVEAAGHLAQLCTTTNELTDWTTIATGVYATFGDSLPIEGLTEAANETAKTGALTGGLADALNWAGVSETDFQAKLDACSSEQERQALITSTLNGLYADAAQAYRENSAEVIAANEAQDKLNATMAKIGGAVEPIITKGKELLAEVLEQVIPHIETLAGVVIPALFGAISTAVSWVGSLVQGFKDLRAWCQENETMLTILAVAVGTLTTAIVAYNAANAIRNAGGIVYLAQLAATAVGVGALTVAETAHSVAATVAATATTAFGAAVAFLTSPITLIIAAIGAVIAIVVLLVKNWDKVKEAAAKCWDWICDVWKKASTWFYDNVIAPVVDFFVGLWDSIVNIFRSVLDWVKENFVSIVLFIINPFAGVFSYLYNNFEGFRNFVNNILSAIGGFFVNIGTTIKNAFMSALDAVKNAWNGIKNWFTNLLNGVKSIFSNIVSGLATIFKKPINTIIGGINSFIRGINKVTIPDWVPGVGGRGFNISTIPLLEEGAVLEKGQTGFLEGNGAEAVVPLHNNKKWISAVAQDMAQNGLGGNAAGSQELLEAFLGFVAELPDILADAFPDRLSVNNREFARLVKAVD